MRKPLLRFFFLAAVAALWASLVFAQDEKEATNPPVSQSSNLSSTSQAPAGQIPQPSPEMQSLARAFEGRWSITEKFEPDEWSPNGGVGYGEEVWRSGPGGFTLMEEIHDKGAAGELFGLAITWWDKAKGLQGMWCAGENPKGCDLNSSTVLKWDGKQFVFDSEFSQGGKTFAWHEVFSESTPTSFTQTADIGESGGPLKRWVTIQATRVAEVSMKPVEVPSAETELRAAMDERRKASLEGDTEKTASSMADDYIQTDIAGYVQNKTTWLSEYFKPLAELIKAGKFRWDAFDEKDIQIRMYGDTAVVTGRLDLKGVGARPAPPHTWVVDPEARPSLILHFTRVYIRRNGKWLLAALHNAVPLPPPTASK